MHMVFDLSVQHVSGSVAEDVVDAELLESLVAIDVVDEAIRFEEVGIDDETVPRRLEYAPLGALIAIRFKIPCCKTAQLKSTSSAIPPPVAKQSQPAYWP